jgi:tetratricopeptide (TPR) repeat protein
MLKLTRIRLDFRVFAAAAALAALASPAPAFLGFGKSKPTPSPTPAPTPASTPAAPPAFNAEAPPAPVMNMGDASAGTAAAAAPTTDSDGHDLATQAADNSAVAAPTISDDQQIRNAMDMCYQMYHAEDYDSVAKACAAILDKYPKKGLYWVIYLQALSQEHQDLYTPAIEGYEKVKELAPRSTYSNAATFRIGLCQAKSGQKEEAIYTLRDIIENNPRSEYRLQAYLHLGNLYRDTRDWKAASRIYKDMIHYYPNTQWAWTSTVYLAETHAHQGDVDGAVRIYEALIRDPQAPLVMRAQSQLKVGDLMISDQRWLEALQTYKEALRDFGKVPGVASTCEEKIKVATEGRKWGRVPYRQVRTGISVTEAPEDQDYRLKQQQEKVPYQQ